MENEHGLMIDVEKIVVKAGSIEFKQFKNLKDEALKLAAQIETVQVNENNLKQSKKLLAAVNKRLKELEDKRISIKKMMLEPYQLFESQVKEIVGIVKDADETVRRQVKYLEESERAEKKAILKDLFDKRMKHYSFRDLFGFKDFLQPRHLNKTTSVNVVESEMIAFLEKLTNDLRAIEKMPNAKTILSAYIESKDLAHAITQANELEQRQKQIEASKAMNESANEMISFTVYSKKDFLIVEMFMQQNKIKFTAMEGGI